MTDTSDKAIEALAAAPWAYASADLSAMLTALQAERATQSTDYQRGLEDAARVGYIVCAETRHVTLGMAVEKAIRALISTPPTPTDPVKDAAKVLLAAWAEGLFENGADAVADDFISANPIMPDASDFLEVWLRALAGDADKGVE